MTQNFLIQKLMKKIFLLLLLLTVSGAKSEGIAAIDNEPTYKEYSNKNLLALDRILKHFFQHQMFIDRAFSRAYLHANLFDFNMYIRISKEEDVSDQIFELYNFGYYYTDDDKQLVKIIKL